MLSLGLLMVATTKSPCTMGHHQWRPVNGLLGHQEAGLSHEHLQPVPHDLLLPPQLGLSQEVDRQ